MGANTPPVITGCIGLLQNMDRYYNTGPVWYRYRYLITYTLNIQELPSNIKSIKNSVASSLTIGPYLLVVEKSGVYYRWY